MRIPKELLKLEEELNIEKTKFDLRSRRVFEKIQETEETNIEKTMEEAIDLYKTFNNKAEIFLEN